LKVSELSKSLSDLESRSRKPLSSVNDYRTTSSKSSSRQILKTQNFKVKTTSSPIFYGKAGTRTKLKKDTTSGAKYEGTDNLKSFKPHTPKSQRGLYKQVYVPVAPKLILISENTSSNEKGLLKENLQQLNEPTQSLKSNLVKPSSNSTSVFIPDKRRKEGLAFEKDVKRRPSKQQSFNLAFQKCHSYKRSGLGYEPQVVDVVCNKLRSTYLIDDVMCNYNKSSYFNDYLCRGSYYSVESFKSKYQKSKKNTSPKVYRKKKIISANQTVSTNPKEPIMQWVPKKV